MATYKLQGISMPNYGRAFKVFQQFAELNAKPLRELALELHTSSLEALDAVLSQARLDHISIYNWRQFEDAAVLREPEFSYRHTRRGDFCIQRLTIDQEGFTTWAGDLVLVSKQEMSRTGLAVVRSCLAEFGKLDAADASELMRLTPRERSRFISEHASVGIDLEDDHTMSFNPMNKTSGGAVGRAQDRFTVTLPMRSEEFYEHLQRAFGLASEGARRIDEV